MTCIVGLVENGNVIIGADSAGVTGSDITVRKDTKVFKIDNFIFGCTSSFRMIQLLKYSLQIPKRGKESLDKFMSTKFIDSIIECFEIGGFLTKSADGQFEGGTFLVGTEGRLFAIESDFQVSENADLYETLGIGENFAKGALHILKSSKYTSEEKVKLALKTAEKFSGGVCKPFKIVKI